MSEADPRIEAYYAETKTWRREKQALRAILQRCPVTETFKWRGPCYTAHGGNIAMVGGIKAACLLSFFKGVLLTDPEGILAPPGENSRSARMATFTAVEEIERLAPVLEAYVREAVGIEKAGGKVEFAKDDLARPEELTRLLAEDADLAAAFEALTPGRRRGWLLHFSQPKTSATRDARIARSRAKILAGKGMHDR